ncbi:hypothetical protein H6775_01765 [Candidatus Nomurabacteria bacterium]|nr:hypothetical protein [Candidatus Nomurabacteria bacterium]
MAINTKENKIIFYGARASGLLSLLTILSKGYEVVAVVSDDEGIIALAKNIGIDLFGPPVLNTEEFTNQMLEKKAKTFFCCHGRRIIKNIILDNFISVNVHPCLYKYKGADPIGRMLEDGETKGSVAVHYMTEEVDEGEVVAEIFKEIESKNVIEVYNELYPVYAEVTAVALDKINI